MPSLQNFFAGRSEPPTPPGVTREVRGDGWHVRLDLSPQVLSLEIPAKEFGFGDLELHPVPSRAEQRRFVSASMLAMAAKIFDDGLYAAAELFAQPAKAALLSALSAVAPPIAAAAHLGGLNVLLDGAAKEAEEDFLLDELASKLLGFFTWSEDLGRIFRQDRLLQRKLSVTDARALRAALRADPRLSKWYGEHLDLVAKLTNPLRDEECDLRSVRGQHFFPASRSHESDLGRRLFDDRPIPEGFCLADEVITRLRNGSLSFVPTEASGWYDWQSWALEALVLLDRMPEGARLVANAEYRRQLDELFKAVLALTRETHVKQLPTIVLGMPRDPHWQPVPVALIPPELTVEPVRAYYDRRADSYDFIREVLESAGRLDVMHRWTADGPMPRPLYEELREMAAVFRGAAAVVGEELGMEAAPGEVKAAFCRWAEGPGMSEDVRMMVPVFYDRVRRQVKVWAVLGWDARDLHVSFAEPPSAKVVKGWCRVKFIPLHQTIAYPVFAEVYVSRLLDRKEFRAHCDRFKTVDRILANL